MYTLLIVFYVLVSASLIGLILIQQGKGADAGAAFGSGASGTVFGSRGSANFLTRATAILATIFFILSLALAYVVHGRSAPGSVVDTAPAVAAPVPEATPPAAAVPAAPDAAAAQPAPSTPPAATEPAAKAPVTDQPATTPAPAKPKTDAATQPAPTPKVPQ